MWSSIWTPTAGAALCPVTPGGVRWKSLPRRPRLRRLLSGQSGQGCLCILGLRVSQWPSDGSREDCVLDRSHGRSPYHADNIYGRAKLMGEMALQAYCKERGHRAACCRHFTVYGNRGRECNAVIAMIARAFLHQNPSRCGATVCKSAIGRTLVASSRERSWLRKRLFY